MIRGDEPEEDSIPIDSNRTITSNEAVAAAEILISYYQQAKDFTLSPMDTLLQMREYAMKKALLE